MELENETIADRLEKILMPHMSENKAKLEASGNKFIHYTSAENSLNILNSQRLWLRNPSCMNDYMEISHGYQMLLNFFSDVEKKNKFTLAIDAYEDGLAKMIFSGLMNGGRK
jgi:hypothetical protein